MPRTPEDVAAALQPFGLQVRRLPADTSTAPLAAAALGTTVDRIVKSLIFMAGDLPVLVLVAGDRTVDVKRVQSALDAGGVRLAKPSEVVQLTGFRVGGVPPVGHLTPIRTLIDAPLADQNGLWAAAGDVDAVFEVDGPQLVAMTGGRAVDLS